MRLIYQTMKKMKIFTFKMRNYYHTRAVKELIEGVLSVGVSFTGAYLGYTSTNVIGIWYALFSGAFGLIGIYEIIQGLSDLNKT